MYIEGLSPKFNTPLMQKGYTIAALLPAFNGKDLQQRLNQPHNLAVDLCGRARGIDDLDAGGMGAGNHAEALLDAAMEGFACAVETRGGSAQTAWIIGRIDALLDLGGIEVEENGEVGNVSLGSDY